MNEKQTMRLGFLVLCLLLLVTYGQVAWSVLVDCWNDENYSHGILIPVVVLAFVVARRTLQPEISPRQKAWLRLAAVACLVLGMVAYVIGSAAAEEFSIRISGILTGIGLVGLLGGPPSMLRYLAPLCLLFFMVPLPYSIYYRISFPLQLLSAKLAAGSMDVLGFEVSRWGNVFEVNGERLEVVRACSGVRSMMTLAALAATSALAMRFSLARGWGLLMASLPIAMLGNAIRLVATAMLVVWVGPQAAKGTIHDAVGVMSFMISVVLLGGVWRLLRGRLAEPLIPTSRDLRGISWRGLANPAFAGRGPLLGSVMALLVVTLYGKQLDSPPNVPATEHRLSEFPMSFKGLVGREVDMSDGVLEKVGVQDYLFRNYEAPWGPDIGLYVGYYDSQRQGSQIHSPQHCYPGAGFDVEDSAVLKVRNFEGEIEELRRLTVERNGNRSVVVYWYDTRTGRLSSDIRLKLNLMQTALLRQPQDAAFVRWSTQLAEDEDVEQATMRLLKVAAAGMPHLERLLPFKNTS